MVGQIRTQKYRFTENFVPKNMRILHIFTHKFDGKELFLGYYKNESEKNKRQLLKILPHRNGMFMLQILDPKITFKWNFRPKNMARTAFVCKHGKYPLG